MKYLILALMLSLTSSVMLSSQDKIVRIPGTDQSLKMVLVDTSEFDHPDGSRIIVPAYYIGQYEVTHDQWRVFQDIDFDSDKADKEGYAADAITRPSPPYEDFTKGMGKEGGYPAVSITQQGATRYCEWLYKKTGVFFRLPTELEWQVACDLGNTDKQEEVKEVAWYFDNSFEKFHKVGEKEANQLGIYDMLGNVAEWTSDQYTADYPDSMSGQSWIPPTKRHSRTVKGGSYYSDIDECACKYREKSDPRWQMRDPQIPKSLWWNTDAPYVGFRVIIPVDEITASAIADYYKEAIVD